MTAISDSELSKHDAIKAEILKACRDLGFSATQEYRGEGWRADVFVSNTVARVAFEIQVTHQSLKKTLERQEKYSRDEVTGCWLFEKPSTKLLDERPDLPLFYVSGQDANSFSVSLSGRKQLSLDMFVEEFLNERIRFSPVARTTPEQKIKLVFFEMKCWHCQKMNHVYFVETNLHSACNAVIHPYETMWGSNKTVYRPEIIELARKFANTEDGKHIRLGEIKARFSNTLQDSYTSFGCYYCDSIFGDWYVMEAQSEAVYGYGQFASVEDIISIREGVIQEIPHWCYPDKLPFCDKW